MVPRVFKTPKNCGLWALGVVESAAGVSRRVRRDPQRISRWLRRPATSPDLRQGPAFPFWPGSVRVGFCPRPLEFPSSLWCSMVVTFQGNPGVPIPQRYPGIGTGCLSITPPGIASNKAHSAWAGNPLVASATAQTFRHLGTWVGFRGRWESLQWPDARRGLVSGRQGFPRGGDQG